MKKRILLLPVILLIIQSAQAQKPDAAVALVRYTFSHIRDTTNRANIYTENMELLLGKNGSVYRSADKRLQDEQIKKQVAEQFNVGARGNIQVNLGNKGRTTGTEYYQFQAEKKLIRQERQFNYYLIEETLPVLNWKIMADTTSFSSLHCQKATTAFKGRNYEAWFCAALPFRCGPWKLNGLPGLIVEASDSKKEVIWKFAGLEDAGKIAENNASAEAGSNTGKVTQIIGLGDENVSSKTIALPASGIKTTEKEFAQLRETMRKDPQAFVQAAMAGAGVNAKITSSNTTTITPVKNTLNNPIELTEKP
ncbi:MAG: GLPGLI family protein [Sphingobacteriaceae bacterium]|nr:MAG: GLPGLI family protein [Sphingobacteriaceae bacterium]